MSGTLLAGRYCGTCGNTMRARHMELSRCTQQVGLDAATGRPGEVIHVLAEERLLDWCDEGCWQHREPQVAQAFGLKAMWPSVLSAAHHLRRLRPSGGPLAASRDAQRARHRGHLHAVALQRPNARGPGIRGAVRDVRAGGCCRGRHGAGTDRGSGRHRTGPGGVSQILNGARRQQSGPPCWPATCAALV